MLHFSFPFSLPILSSWPSLSPFFFFFFSNYVCVVFKAGFLSALCFPITFCPQFWVHFCFFGFGDFFFLRYLVYSNFFPPPLLSYLILCLFTCTINSLSYFSSKSADPVYAILLRTVLPATLLMSFKTYEDSNSY